MSGLAVCLNPDGRAVSPATTRAMAAAMTNRGVVNWWSGGPVALAASTPPLVAGNFVAAWDGRIDNAVELAAILGLDPDECTDARLALAAYRRWGQDCPTKLVGEFAFAIWDGEHRRLFCARDQFGVRPFFYHSSSAGFAAGSTAAAVVAAPFVSGEPSETGLADYLAGISIDPQATMYEGVCRLPPAHHLVVRDGAASVKPYWHIGEVTRDDGRDAGERFAMLFNEAVRCRMTASSAVGVMLSGGLDSSSIAAVAARQRQRDGGPNLPSLSMTFRSEPRWNEQPYIDAVLGRGGLDPIFVPHTEDDLVSALGALLDEQDCPVLAYNGGISRRLYHVAAAAGVDVLLDGHGGDEVVSHGQGRLNELAQAGSWRTLWAEARGIAAIHGHPTWHVVSPYASHNRWVRAVRARLGGWRRAGVVPDPTADDLVDPSLAARVGLAGRKVRARRPRYASDTERDLHVATLVDPGHADAFDVLGNMAATAGVTPSYPFYDRRLVEFCVALPAHAKLRDGQPRRVMRDAMTGILPESVRLRPDKFDFAGQLASQVSATVPLIRDMIDREPGLSDFLNVPVAKAMLDRVAHGGAVADTADVFGVWRVLVLGLWLERRHGVAMRVSA